MANERAPDLSGPDYEALEAKVSRMMDTSLPDEAATNDAAVTSNPPKAEKPKTINKATSKHPIKINITHFAEPDQAEAPTAPPIDSSELPEPPNDPLIPSDQLASTFETKPPAPEPEPNTAAKPPKPPKTRAKSSKAKATKAAKATKNTEADKVDKDTQTPTAPPIKSVGMPSEADQAQSIADKIKQYQAAKKSTVAAAAAATQTAKQATGQPAAIADDSDSVSVDPLPGMRPMRRYLITPETPGTPVVGAEASQAETAGQSVGANPLDNPTTNQAVDDIEEHDSDTILQTETGGAGTFRPDKDQRRRRSFNPLGSRWLRRLIILLVVAGLAVVIIRPATRYFVLNSVGVHSSASLIVYDQSTQQPLQNVQVTIGKNSQLTNAMGKVILSGLRLGPAKLTISKTAFATQSQNVTVGWGSNPLGSFYLTPTGAQYTLAAIDYFSGRALPNVQASINGTPTTAQADSQGIIKLTLNETSQAFNVILTSAGYRTEQVSVDPNQHEQQTVKMVPAHPDIYVSRQNGGYDVYKSDLDGQNATLLLKGTGNETSDLALVSSPSLDAAALVSFRQTTVDSNGDRLRTLTIVSADDGTNSALVSAPVIHILGWSGNYLLYLQSQASAKADDASRQRLVSYNFVTKQSQTLASANSFNAAVVANGTLYFAPNKADQPTNNIGLFAIQPDGSAKQTLLNLPVDTMVHPNYNQLIITANGNLYAYKLGDKTAVPLTSVPSDQSDHVFLDSPDGTRSLWFDSVNDKLMVYDISAQKSSALDISALPIEPFGWLSNGMVIYRVSGGGENADYAISLISGSAHKVQNVTAVDGLTVWHNN